MTNSLTNVDFKQLRELYIHSTYKPRLVMRIGFWQAGNMFAIHFKSKASKEQAVRCLTGKVQFKDGKPGALVVNEDAVVLLTARGIPFVRSCTDVIPVANEQPVFAGGFAC